MKTKVIVSKNAMELSTKLKHVINDDFSPNLAIIFSNFSKSIKEVQSIISPFDLDICGVTSGYEIAGGVCYSESIVTLLLELDKRSYQLQIFHSNNHPDSTITQKIGLWVKHTFSKPAILAFLSNSNIIGDDFVDGIQKEQDSPIPLFGGYASNTK